jgi:hypothetical protein
MNKVVIIFVLLIILLFIIHNSKEKFFSYFGPANNIDSYRYCDSCDKKTTYECSECINCGVCVNGNVSKCINGDRDGPSKDNQEKCEQWIYGDNNINNYATTYIQPVYPYYYDMFYPPYYYDGLYYGSGSSGNSTYNSRRYFRNKHRDHGRHDGGRKDGGRKDGGKK